MWKQIVSLSSNASAVLPEHRCSFFFPLTFFSAFPFPFAISLLPPNNLSYGAAGLLKCPLDPLSALQLVSPFSFCGFFSPSMVSFNPSSSQMPVRPFEVFLPLQLRQNLHRGFFSSAFRPPVFFIPPAAAPRRDILWVHLPPSLTPSGDSPTLKPISPPTLCSVQGVSISTPPPVVIFSRNPEFGSSLLRGG